MSDKIKTPEEISQWIIDNRYPKGEYNSISDFEMYHELKPMIKVFSKIVAQQALENASEKANVQMVQYGHRYACEIDKSSITTPNNIPLTI